MAEATAPINLTPKAIKRLQEIVAKGGNDVVGVRVSVEQKGCTGYAYKIDYIKDVQPNDIKLNPAEGVTLYIDPKASLILYGSTMDYVTEQLSSRFEFVNPNEKGRCGCGESFHV